MSGFATLSARSAFVGCACSGEPPPCSGLPLSVLTQPTAASCFDFVAAPLLGVGGAPSGCAGVALLRGSACSPRLLGDLSGATTERALLRELSFADHAGLAVAALRVGAFEGGALACGAALARACALRGSHAGLPLLCARVALDEGEAGWRAWHCVRALCGRGAAALGACVEVGAELPPPALQQRWLAEPVHVAVLPTALFSPNGAGMPTLPAGHQALVARLVAHGVALLVEGEPAPGLGAALAAQAAAVARGEVTGDAETLSRWAAAPLRAYAAYLRYVGARLLPAQSAEEAAIAPWADALQSPLQPLSDHLENSMYEVFERDAPKYEAYERAMRAALTAMPAGAHPVRVCVAGAGRGPLLRRLLAAAEAAGVLVRAWAVEKNPNAVLHLHGVAEAEGWAARGVTVVHADARTWAGPSDGGGGFHLLVSELLGSFGDNELSPECLGDAEPLLAPGGASIPSEYTSYLAPISSAKLWAGAFARGGCESPFVVRALRAAPLAPPMPAFSFRHPGHAVGSGRRGVRLEFDPAAVGALPALLHGFSGYFSAVLWGGDGAAAAAVRLCTLPASHEPPDMLSWFPLFLPLSEPVLVERGQRVVLQLWRCVEELEPLAAGGGGPAPRQRGAPGRVWFEWALLEPKLSAVHNVSGRAAVMLL
jgi:protein arginine N-methyltransferase 5